jgi:hypothetical protein
VFLQGPGAPSVGGARGLEAYFTFYYKISKTEKKKNPSFFPSDIKFVGSTSSDGHGQRSRGGASIFKAQDLARIPLLNQTIEG